MSEVNLDALSRMSAATQRIPPEKDRAAKAARDFEALLLTNWLQSVDEGLKSLSGDSEEAGADTMNGIAMQAIAAGVAARGGVGLAKMMLQHLPIADSTASGQTRAGAAPESQVQLSGTDSDRQQPADGSKINFQAY